MKVSQYAKGIIAGIAAVCITIATVLADNVVSPADWFIIAAAVLGAFGVVQVPNTPLLPKSMLDPSESYLE